MKLEIKYIIVGLLLLVALVNCKKSSKNCVQGSGTEPVCTTDYNPVCGCNEITYSNACQASKDGISDYTEGECP